MVSKTVCGPRSVLSKWQWVTARNRIATTATLNLASAIFEQTQFEFQVFVVTLNHFSTLGNEYVTRNGSFVVVDIETGDERTLLSEDAWVSLK